MRFYKILCILFVVSGCSATSMTPAHRMNTGELTLDLAVTEPGVAFIPKVAAGGTLGLGAGDVTLQAASSFAAVSVTVAPRIYFGDIAELKIEGTYWSQVLKNERLLPFQSIFIVPRAGLSLRGDDGWFGGLQNVTIVPIETEQEVSDRIASSDITALIGGYAGYGWRSGSWTYQIEVSGSPIPIANPENEPLTTYLLGTWQAAFSAHYWIGR